MRKITTFLMLFISTLMAFANTTPIFYDNFDDLSQWTIINANEDDYTWEPYVIDAENNGVSIRWNSDLQSNDWIISPAFSATADGTYSIIFECRAGGTSSEESLDVYVGNDNTVEGMTTQVKSIVDLKTGSEYWRLSALVELKAGEIKHIGFHAVSKPNQWRIILKEVSVVESSPYDLSVTEITSPVSGKELTTGNVTIKVKNLGFADVASIPVSYTVDGEGKVEEVINTPLNIGETLEYTFVTPVDLSTPRKSYVIAARTEYPADAAPENDEYSVSVRHIAPATAPYFMGFENDEDTSGIQFFNLNEDDGNWSIETGIGWWNMARTGASCLMYDYNKVNDGDDWAILEGINVDPGYYSLKFWYASMNNHSERLAVYWGTSPEPSAMKNLIVKYDPFNCDFYSESASIVNFTEAQTIYIGFYAFSDKDENVIMVDDVSFTKITSETIDVTVFDLENPESYVREDNDKNITFKTSNLGIVDITANLTVTVDDQEVYNKDVELKAQETKAFEIADALVDLAFGKHTVKIELICDKDANQDNNIITKDFIVVNSPTMYWDFETGEMPTDLKFVTKDDGSVNNSVSDLVDGTGWGLLEIQPHARFGSWMLGVTSYLDNTDKADRWCILPKMKIEGTNSHLVWNANSIDERYLESYKIMISTTDDELSSFSTGLDVINEQPDSPATRGIDLSNYAGQEIYLAFRLVSRDCFILTLDNIGLYGVTPSGVNKIDANQIGKISIENKTINVSSDDVKAIQLFDTSGSLIKTTEGSSVNVEALPSGIYILMVNTANGVIREKIRL